MGKGIAEGGALADGFSAGVEQGPVRPGPWRGRAAVMPQRRMRGIRASGSSGSSRFWAVSFCTVLLWTVRMPVVGGMFQRGW